MNEKTIQHRYNTAGNII